MIVARRLFVEKFFMLRDAHAGMSGDRRTSFT